MVAKAAANPFSQAVAAAVAVEEASVVAAVSAVAAAAAAAIVRVQQQLFLAGEQSSVQEDTKSDAFPQLGRLEQIVFQNSSSCWSKAFTELHTDPHTKRAREQAKSHTNQQTNWPNARSPPPTSRNSARSAAQKPWSAHLEAQ